MRNQPGSSLASSLLPLLSSSFSLLDLHFAHLMSTLAGKESAGIILAAALASNRVQEGHVCLDLSEYAGKPVEFDNAPVAADRWPTLDRWTAELAVSRVVGSPGACRPLVLFGTLLYLYRYWDYEQRLITVIRDRSTGIIHDFDGALAVSTLNSLFPQSGERIDYQKTAAAIALLKRLCILSGGPGTGKTATVIRVAALLATLYSHRTIRIALVAPTGKAAARLEESIGSDLPRLGCPPPVASLIPQTASTIHSLLKPLPDSPFFRHHTVHPLPFDVVIVDEASMIDLPLMTKLFDAIPLASRAILIGDKDQLASVEAGAILGDICGGAGVGYSAELCTAIQAVMPEFIQTPEVAVPVADTIVMLQTNYRFGDCSGIGRVSSAINRGDYNEIVATLSDPAFADAQWWVPPSYEAFLDRLEKTVSGHLRGLLNARDPAEALRFFAGFRILCAIRNGPLGVSGVNGSIETILARLGLIDSVVPPFYPGRPVMVVRNDYDVNLYNGDTGIVLPDENDSNSLKAFFPDGSNKVRAIALTRLPPHETAWAITVHKAQGSEFGRTILVLPSRPSPIVTRELLYTGITRARLGCELWATEEVLRIAVATRIRRTSGIREGLRNDRLPQ